MSYSSKTKILLFIIVIQLFYFKCPNNVYSQEINHFWEYPIYHVNVWGKVHDLNQIDEYIKDYLYKNTSKKVKTTTVNSENDTPIDTCISYYNYFDNVYIQTVCKCNDTISFKKEGFDPKQKLFYEQNTHFKHGKSVDNVIIKYIDTSAYIKNLKGGGVYCYIENLDTLFRLSFGREKTTNRINNIHLADSVNYTIVYDSLGNLLGYKEYYYDTLTMDVERTYDKNNRLIYEYDSSLYFGEYKRYYKYGPNGEYISSLMLSDADTMFLFVSHNLKNNEGTELLIYNTSKESEYPKPPKNEIDLYLTHKYTFNNQDILNEHISYGKYYSDVDSLYIHEREMYRYENENRLINYSCKEPFPKFDIYYSYDNNIITEKIYEPLDHSANENNYNLVQFKKYKGNINKIYDLKNISKIIEYRERNKNKYYSPIFNDNIIEIVNWNCYTEDNILNIKLKSDLNTINTNDKIIRRYREYKDYFGDKKYYIPFEQIITYNLNYEPIEYSDSKRSYNSYDKKWTNRTSKTSINIESK